LSAYTIVPYERKHRQAIFDLIFESHNTHIHLDWHRSDEWLELEDNTILLAFADDSLHGVMGFAGPLVQTCWLRLLIIADEAIDSSITLDLWHAAKVALRGQNIHKIAVLLLEDWARKLYKAMGLTHVENIITLSRGGQLPPERKERKLAVTVQLASVDHIAQMVAIDNSAFDPIWQMTTDEIRRAKKLAAVCTIARTPDSTAIGYQLSTLYNRSGHLARIAVSPNAQNMGVGAALLDDLLWRLMRRETRGVTVNTQSTNWRSQRLYQHYGFRRNGHSIPVWMAKL